MSKSKYERREMRGTIMFIICLIIPFLILLIYLLPVTALEVFNYFAK